MAAFAVLGDTLKPKMFAGLFSAAPSVAMVSLLVTGLATGPHLDYRMVKSGVFVNPLKIQSPPAEPIAAGERDAFQAACQSQLALLDPAPAGPALASAPSIPAAAAP